MKAANTIQARLFMDQISQEMKEGIGTDVLSELMKTIQFPLGYLNVRVSMLPEKWFGVS